MYQEPSPHINETKNYWKHERPNVAPVYFANQDEHEMNDAEQAEQAERRGNRYVTQKGQDVSTKGWCGAGREHGWMGR